MRRHQTWDPYLSRLRYMAGTRCEPENAFRPETARQPIDQTIDRLARPCSPRPIIQLLLSGVQSRHFDGVQRHQVDAKASIETRNLFTKKSPEMTIVSAWRAGADRNVTKRAIGAIKRETKAAATNTGSLESTHEITAQPVERRLNADRSYERVGERQAR